MRRPAHAAGEVVGAGLLALIAAVVFGQWCYRFGRAVARLGCPQC